MITSIILFLVGLVLLIKGGDWFVDGATGIAHKFHVPDLLIGATVVSIGTTLPEVMVSATSAVSGHGEIAYGNAIGSIICNTALIAAISIAVKPSRVDKKTLTIPVIFFYVSTALYLFSAYVTKRFDRVTGVLLLLISSHISAFRSIRRCTARTRRLQQRTLRSQRQRPTPLLIRPERIFFYWSSVLLLSQSAQTC